MDDLVNSFMTGPDEKGRFGIYGGRFVSETLMPLILELEEQYERAKTDQSFWDEMAGHVLSSGIFNSLQAGTGVHLHHNRSMI